MKAGEGGKVFGSVSSKEIVKAFKEQENVELDKKKIQMSEPIKAFGSYELEIKLHPQVTATLHVKVVEA
jgi:large subunit ribosomal protein L9